MTAYGPQEKNPILRHAGRLTEVDRPRISRHVERSAASKMTQGDHAQHIDGQIVANENCSWKDGGEL